MRTLILFPLSLLFAACVAQPGVDADSKDTDTDTDADTDTDEPLVDADGDGYGEGEDCNDADAGINPGAAEVCDPGDVDEDCNGQADSGDPTLTDGTVAYHDVDGDGYGDPDSEARVCEVGGGYVLEGRDCDDGDADINPEATERCDPGDADEDCDGRADNDDDAEGATSWYVDADDDGLGDDDAAPVLACDDAPGLAYGGGDCDDGDAATGLPQAWFLDTDGDGYGDGRGSVACAPPPGEASVDGDCDDAAAGVNPAAAELCNGWDDDCDGDVDDEDAGLDLSSATTWYADDDGDGHAGTTTAEVRCDAPIGYVSVTLADDCDDGDASTYPGAEEVCNDGADNACDGDWTECRLGDMTVRSSTADAMFVGEDATDYAGGAVALPGDLNGDGYGDLLVGAPYASTSYTYEGALYLFFGPVTGTTDLSAADGVYTGDESRAYAGFAVSGGGDIDGDGTLDLVVGSPGAGSNKGEVHVAYETYVGTSTLSGLPSTGILAMTEADAGCGASVAGAGDLDGDGRDDLAVGCYYASHGATHSGVVWLVTTAPTGTASLDTEGYAITTSTSYSGLGTAVGFADVDGDGAQDLLAGAVSRHSVFVLHGPITADRDVATADASFAETSGVLQDLSAAGDTNADGYEDVLVGQYTYVSGSTRYGRAILFPGGPSGISTAAGDYFRLDGTSTTGANTRREGSSLAAAGDVDADGYDDFLVGSSHQDGLYDNGAAWLVYGPVTGDSDLDDHTRFSGNATADNLGYSVAGGSDVSGDGLPDLLIGDNENGTGGTLAGAAYLIFGSSL